MRSHANNNINKKTRRSKANSGNYLFAFNTLKKKKEKRRRNSLEKLEGLDRGSTAGE